MTAELANPPVIHIGMAELAICQFCPPMIDVGTAEVAKRQVNTQGQRTVGRRVA